MFFCLLLVFTISTLAVADGACYSPNGTVITELDIQPCIQISGVASMCCATKRAGTPDDCLPNGLCQNGDTFWRDYCTDPTWSSPHCLPRTICGNDEYTQMTLCLNGSWCCGEGNFTSCCDKDLGFNLTDNLVQFKATSTNHSSSSQPLDPAETTGSSCASSTSGFGDRERGHSFHGDQGVTIGLGVGLGVLAVLGTLGGFFAGSRRGFTAARNREIMPVGVPQYNNSIYSSEDGLPKEEETDFKVDKVQVYETLGTPISETEGTPIAELGEGCVRR